MKSNELRIGNLINNGISDVEISAKHILGINNRAYETVRPIPITNEWLVKFGFKTSNEKVGWYKKRDFKYTSRLVSFGLKICLIDGGRHYEIKTCKYIHELQNFYYIIENKEL